MTAAAAARDNRTAYRQAANRVAGKIYFDQLLCAVAAQIGESRSLHNAELPLRQIAVALRLLQKVFARALSPCCGAFHGGFRAGHCRPRGFGRGFYLLRMARVGVLGTRRWKYRRAGYNLHRRVLDGSMVSGTP